MRGELLADRFRIAERLGAGGMGEVWAAQDERMRRDVAVKLVHAFGAHEEETRARFRREVQLAGRLSHQNIVTVHDWGEVPVGGRPVFYLVMELVRGVSLGRRLKEGVPVWPLGVGWAVQIAQALDAAHRRGVVHRDIKPANVLLTPEGTAKVLDFGVAKFLGETMSVHELTVTGALLGSPPYMSPEQAEGAREIDHRSDLYSLGCLLYHALTGRPPFVSDSPLAVLRRHMDETPVPPARLTEDLPDTLDDLVVRLLAKDPGDRPVDADAVHEALVTVLVEESLGPGGRAVLDAARLGNAESVAGRFLGKAWQSLRRAEEENAARRAQAERVLADARRAASREGEQAARDIDAIRGAARTEADLIRATAVNEGTAVLDGARADAAQILENARREARTVMAEARREARIVAEEARREPWTVADGAEPGTARYRAVEANESAAVTEQARAEVAHVSGTGRAAARREAGARMRARAQAEEGQPARVEETGGGRPEKSKTKRVLTYLGIIEDDGYDGGGDDDVGEAEPEPGPEPAPGPVVDSDDARTALFWMAVPVARPLMPEDGGVEPIGELLPGTWYLAVETRGSALVVQRQDGLRGILQDTFGIQRA